MPTPSQPTNMRSMLFARTSVSMENMNRFMYPKKRDRKSTRLNSSHGSTSYAVFCLKKKKANNIKTRTTQRLCYYIVHNLLHSQSKGETRKASTIKMRSEGFTHGVDLADDRDISSIR